MRRFHPAVLAGSTILLSWLGMQAVHECGHVLAALGTGGTVKQVVLHPLSISRTELAHNPQPLFVAWSGPMFGVLLPLSVWFLSVLLRLPWQYLLRFFAGFCLVANGAYIGAGAIARIGDADDMLRHGSPMWQLLTFAAVTVPSGFLLWHGLASYFGLGHSPKHVPPAMAYVCLALCIIAISLELALSAR